MAKAKLRDKYGDEQVFVVPYTMTTDIPDLFTAKRITARDLNSIEVKGKYILRYDAEYNNEFQQIIPYIIVTSEDLKRIYVSERIAGEERLRQKLSFFGGHINPCDASTGKSIIVNGAKRELNEEVKLIGAGQLKAIGTVRDKGSTTPDHTGIVLSITAKEAEIKETDGMNGKWMTLDQVITDYAKFEGWARYIIDHVFKSGKKDFSSIR